MITGPINFFINAQEKYGYAAMHASAQKGHIDVVDQLIANGGNVNIQALNGRTPLHLAAQKGHLDVVVCLCMYVCMYVCMSVFVNSMLSLFEYFWIVLFWSIF